MGNTIAVIVFAVAILIPLERWLSLPWYFSVLLGALGYGCVRYIRYFIRERLYMKRAMEEADTAVRRAQLRQISK
jgi:hypothetical protein